MSEYIEAITALSRVVCDEQHLDDALADKTSPLAKQICYGVIREYYYLDKLLALLLNKPLAIKHVDLHLLIMTGIYSIEHLHRPTHASVNHAVEACAALKKPWAKGLVNGVLRRFIRETEHLKGIVAQDIESNFNQPLWLIQKIQSAWPDQINIIHNSNQQAPMTLRTNQRLTTRAAYLEKLEKAGMSARAGKLCKTAIVLENAVPVIELPGFAQGEASVQDEAPQLAMSLLNLKPGLLVLDACAAPGGKTCHILEAFPSTTLTALDKEQSRVAKIQQNLDRLMLHAKLVCCPLEKFHEEALQRSPVTGVAVTSPKPSNHDVEQMKFDRILLDVPCSATGIIRRHPDIKLLRHKSDIAKLSIIQLDLLHKAFELLKIDGELLYSTCSILPDENDEVIGKFLAERSNAVSEALLSWCKSQSRESITTGSTVESYQLSDQWWTLSESVETRFGLQFFPTQKEHDGFYYARLKKVAEKHPT